MDTFTKIRVLLKQNNMTQKDLTDHLGLSKSVFTDWRTGKNTSYIKHIGAISELLGVSADFLLGTEKSPPSEESELFRLLQEPLAHEMLTFFNQLSEVNQGAVLAMIRYLIDNKSDA